MSKKPPTVVARDLSITVLCRLPKARCKLLEAMSVMPEEAFVYLLRTALYEFPRLARNKGFTPESRKAFTLVTTLAEVYANKM